MPVDADRVARALIADWRRLCDRLGAPAFAMEADGAALLSTGLPIATLNCVLTAVLDPAPDVVHRLLDVVAGRSVPHCVQLRPGAGAALTEMAEGRGLAHAADVPLMVLMREPGLGSSAAIEDRALHIRRLQPSEAGIHVALLAEGFEAPASIFESLITPEVLADAGIHCYVGFVDAEPVTTAMAMTHGESTGIYNVATPPAARGCGYGAAITAHAVRDGFRAGASYAYLQSSAAGFGVYRRLGFETLEEWSVWATA